MGGKIKERTEFWLHTPRVIQLHTPGLVKNLPKVPMKSTSKAGTKVGAGRIGLLRDSTDVSS